MRAAFKHLAWNPEVRLTRVVARALGPAARILRDAADFQSVGLVLLRIPIARPFPDIRVQRERGVIYRCARGIDELADTAQARWLLGKRRPSAIGRGMQPTAAQCSGVGTKA
jgi:hypothetical protein